jgi:putative sterol carrier protein
MAEDREKLGEDLIKELTKRINDNADLIAGWGKAFQIVFTDINVGYWIKVSMDGTVEKVEKAIKKEEAVATISQATETLKGMFDGKISGMEAMSTGLVKVEGPMDALIKLAPAIM